MESLRSSEKFHRGVERTAGVWYNHTMKKESLTMENELAPLPERLLGWYRENARDLPWRHTADPYRIWVSEIMLQQTRVAAVLGYYARFLEAFPTVEALAAASEEQLLMCWEGLGYYSRARNLQKAAKQVVEQGGFPDTYEALLKLPGHMMPTERPHTAQPMRLITGEGTREMHR